MWVQMMLRHQPDDKTWWGWIKLRVAAYLGFSLPLLVHIARRSDPDDPDMSSATDDGNWSKEAHDIQEAGSYDQPDRAQEDVFSDEDSHDIRYKTLSWQVRCA